MEADDMSDTGGGESHDRLRPTASDTIRKAAVEAAMDDSEDMVHTTLSQKMVSALSGSILTSVLVTPLDVVRVRLQSQPITPPTIRFPSSLATSTAFQNLPTNVGISACCREVFWVNNNAPYCVASPSIAILNTPTAIPRSTSSCAAEEIQKKTFNSTLDGLRKIARHEGTTTLWRGLTPTLVMAVPANVIYFSGYDWLRFDRRSPVRRTGVSDKYAPLVAGSSARILAAIAVSPIEMFRTRMQASSSGAAAVVVKETFQGLKDMVASQGPFSLWRGLTLTLWRDVPFSALYWWGYEAGRNILTERRERRSGRADRADRATSPEAFARRRQSMSQENHATTMIDSFLAGAGSGAVASIVTQPFDVGKTRQQVFRHAGDAGQAAAASAARALTPEEQSMPRLLLHIFREQGVPGLFKGWAARCLKVAPACAIMISTYEIGKKMAEGMNERKDGIGQR